jgi:c-di-GMP-binding flagellar brake protein YcgR
MIMDRRKYPRTEATIPIEFNVRHPEATEEPWIGRGVLANLSLTGIFFFPDNQPPLKQGDIRDFTFTLPHAIEGLSRPSTIKARGKVMRIEISEDHTFPGVAVDFLAGPYFGEPINLNT